MVEVINRVLAPCESFLKKRKRVVRYFLIALSFSSLLFLFDEKGIKESGEKALLILWIILWIPIFARVFGLRFFRELLSVSKELGILMGTLAGVHAMMFFYEQPDFIFTSYFWYSEGMLNFLAFGFFALILTLLLTVTSNSWSMKIMGKYWKILHRSAYIIALFTVIHVVLLKWAIEFDYVPVAIFFFYCIGKILEWKKVSFTAPTFNNEYPKGQKWICSPCGYIYDPHLGDPDSGILPNTEFTDIPADWKCPECGVTKSDFVPYEEDVQTQSYEAQVVGSDYLNATTLELTIEVRGLGVSLPGQYVGFLWKDALGEFSRSYSIVEQKGEKFTFTIKLSEGGRGAHILKTLTPGDTIKIRGIFGKFLLKDSLNPKIFIATGTGLAPIYNMITSLKKHEATNRIALYFSVAKSEDLFYEEKINALGVDTHIFLTREEKSGYEYGRLDVDTIDALENTEWYLCGNPKMVEETSNRLKNRGFTEVYSEEFGI